MLPRTPVSTPLSGSARETEIRLRNIFRPQKRRPPALLLALAAALVLLCGGLVSCQNASPSHPEEEAEALLALLAAEDSGIHEEGDAPRLLAAVEQGDYLFGAASCSGRFGDSLLLGVMERDSQTLTGPVYQHSCYYGVPYVKTFQRDGTNYLLYTHNGMHQGLTYGWAGLIRLEGEDFTWVWPVEGDLREASSQAAAQFDAYWQEHLALLSPGGVDVFAQTDYDVLRGEGPQWTLEGCEAFYDPGGDSLSAPLREGVRAWLEDFTREENALNASNRSALYHIASLTREDPLPGQREGDVRCSLTAFCNNRTEDGEGGWFSTSLLVDGDSGQVRNLLSWAQGDPEETQLPGKNLHDLDAALWRDGGNGPVGLGDWQNVFDPQQDGEPTVERLEGWEPVYNPGDYWDRWSLEGFSALRYHNQGEGTVNVYSLETTRTDLVTYRGIRVGDSREAVQSAYPELRREDYWSLYSPAEEDFLWCCADPSPSDLGPAILFFFEDDRVSRIVLWNMFD